MVAQALGSERLFFKLSYEGMICGSAHGAAIVSSLWDYPEPLVVGSRHQHPDACAGSRSNVVKDGG